MMNRRVALLTTLGVGLGLFAAPHTIFSCPPKVKINKVVVKFTGKWHKHVMGNQTYPLLVQQGNVDEVLKGLCEAFPLESVTVYVDGDKFAFFAIVKV